MFVSDFLDAANTGNHTMTDGVRAASDHPRRLEHLPKLRYDNDPLYLDSDAPKPAGSGRASGLAVGAQDLVGVSGAYIARACWCGVMVEPFLNRSRA
jgi:hypothetical protein